MLQRYRFEPIHEDLAKHIGEAEFYQSDEILSNGSRLLISNQGTRPTGSFKVVGMGNQILHGIEQGGEQFVLSSAGSAAMGAAHMIGELLPEHPDIRGKAYVPHDIAPERRQRILDLGRGAVDVDDRYANFDEANLTAIQAATNAPEVTQLAPFDDINMIAGNVHVIESIIEQARQQTDRPLVLSMGVGGAGLLAAGASVALDHQDVRVVGVQYASNLSLEQALAAGHPVAIEQVDTTCAGSAVKMTGAAGFPFIKEAHERGLLTTTRTSRYQLGEELFKDGLHGQEMAWAIGNLAYETQTEATGLLGRVAAPHIGLAPDEVCVAIETGANPDHAKESDAIDDYLKWQRVHAGPRARFTARAWQGGRLS